MASPNNLGDILATDDEVPALKPRSKAAQEAAAQAAAEAAQTAAAPAVAAAKVKPVDRIIRIVLEENDNIPPTGQFISVNGRTFILRPGEEADVPMAVVSVLDNAVQDVPQIDPGTKQVIGYRKRLRFPYRVIQAQAA